MAPGFAYGLLGALVHRARHAAPIAGPETRVITLKGFAEGASLERWPTAPELPANRQAQNLAARVLRGNPGG